MIDRREFLTLALGAAAAAKACTRCGDNAPPPIPDGELFGASADFGHLLRQSIPRPGIDHWREVDVAIVGAGVAGLSAARRLRQLGIENLLVLELETAPGGTARSGCTPYCAFPWGAHYLPLPTRDNPELIALLDEIGAIDGSDADGEPIASEAHLVRDPEERLFFRGRWYEGLWLEPGAAPADHAELQRFQRQIDESTRRRAFAVPIARSRTDDDLRALDQLSFADWLDANRLQSPRLRWLLDYSCRDDYGLTLAETSAWAGLYYFSARQRAPGAPPQPILTWPEGNARLIDALARGLGERLLTGWLALDLAHPPHTALTSPQHPIEITALSSDRRTALGIRARRAILATPQFIAAKLLRDWRSSPPPHLAAFHYGPWIVANLHLTDHPRSLGFPLAWDNVPYESPSLGYVVATHQLGLDRGPTVLTWYHPLAGRDPKATREWLLAATQPQLANLALSDLELMHPGIRRLVTRVDVMRWGHAMIQPRVGFITGQARAQAQQPYRGVQFAHTDLSGMALFEEAFYRGLEVAASAARSA